MPTETKSSSAKFQTTADYDSGWQEANNRSNNAVIFNHNLGATPSLVSIMFSADQYTVFPVLWPWDKGDTGSPVTISMNGKRIQLEITSGEALHGAWSSATGKWTHWSQGYFRVFAWN